MEIAASGKILPLAQPMISLASMDPASYSTPEVLPVEEPVLAQQSEGRATLPTGNAPAEKGTATQEKKTVEPSSDTHGSSQDLGTFVANTLRGKDA